MKNRKTTRVVIFFLIAISISNVFRFQLFGLESFYNSLSVWAKLISSPFQSVGVLLGSLLAISMLKKERMPIHSIFGSSRKWSLFMCSVPIFIFSIWGIENKEGYNPHLIGLIMGLSFIIYCLFEEYGWRGYLEDELKDWKEWKRVLFIAALWYLWHLSFLRNHDLQANLTFFGIIVLGSWGIGKVIHSTKSILSASCFHMIYNIWMLRAGFEVSVEPSQKLWIIGISVALWILIIKLWEGQEKT